MRTLRTARLRLAPVTPANAGALWNMLQQPGLRDYQDLPNVSASTFSEMVAKRPAHLLPRTSGRFEWMVFLSRIRKPVGWVSLRVAERDLDIAEIGYSVLREFRGQGVAQEAVRALLDEAFVKADLCRVDAYCLPDNLPSRRLLKRLGFTFESVLTHGAAINGRTVDVLLHRMTRERWDQSGNSIVMPATAYPA